MPRLPARPLLAATAVFAFASPGAAMARPDELARLVAAFEAQTGARLVFERDDLPASGWFDDMPALDRAAQLAATRILVEQAGRYPRGWLGAIGLQTVGVFAALVDADGDGFRAYDDDLGGYPYFGMWNGGSALIAAYYSDGQLPLTFHHEVFHHVDRASGSATDDDAAFAAAVAGAVPYPVLALPDADRAALVARGGTTLERAVGHYAAKAAGEDQAETARWLMANLPAALAQATTQPDLPGSQRILHVLDAYRAASPAGAPGPDAAWLADVALGRDPAARRAAAAQATTFAQRAAAGEAGIRARIAPRGEPGFVVWGQDSGRGNVTLRRDLTMFTAAARKLAGDAKATRASAAAHAAAGRRLLGQLARYHAFIAARWTVSDGTAAAFAAEQAAIIARLPKPARAAVRGLTLAELATRLAVDGTLAPAAPANPYLAKVDAEIDDPTFRAAIRAVQPAAVKLGGGSGVNLDPRGVILTNAHVADALGNAFDVRFPDGRTFRGVTTAIDARLDLALVELQGAAGLPTARLAAAAPRAGTVVAVIGQPGTRTPDGEATGYQPWHVSTGQIRGFRDGSRTGAQGLGGTKHDAWTYWGHSGSPLFDQAGRIVALHNSWDSSTAMRHAVTWEAIGVFLDAADVAVAAR